MKEMVVLMYEIQTSMLREKRMESLAAWFVINLEGGLSYHDKSLHTSVFAGLRAKRHAD